MTELFEVVIDDIPRAVVFPVLGFLISQPAQIKEEHSSENWTFFASGTLSPIAAQTFLDSRDNVISTFFLEAIQIGEYTLSDTLLRLINCNQKYHMDFNFELAQRNALPMETLAAILQPFFHHLATEFGCTTLYAGWEPAVDLDMRMFTYRGPGDAPLRPSTDRLWS